MKRGKTAKLSGYNEAKIMYGTVDSIELKSIYLNIQTWVNPKKDVDNWQRVVLNFNRSIKHSVFDSIDEKIFDKNFIVDLDLRHSGLQLGKKSFLNLEITFFMSYDENDFKDKKIKELLKNITTNIFDENFRKNEYFTFHLTKSNKNNKVITQMGNY
jgi:hypothetical protein